MSLKKKKKRDFVHGKKTKTNDKNCKLYYVVVV